MQDVISAKNLIVEEIVHVKMITIR